MPLITTSDDFKLHFEEAGSGIPIVFAHEFGGDIEVGNLKFDILPKIIGLLHLTLEAILRQMYQKMINHMGRKELPMIYWICLMNYKLKKHILSACQWAGLPTFILDLIIPIGLYH